MRNRTRTLSLSFGGPVGEQDKQRMRESIFDLKEVHNNIRYEWPQCLEEDTNPIEMAISLLDDTSVGLAYKLPEFEDLSTQTRSALRNVVSEHHEIFNNSIGSYHQLLMALQDSQEDSSQIKTILETATKDITNRSDMLVELSQTSARYSEMIEILDAMDTLTQIPEKIDRLIIDKKIHQVYDVISKAYNLAEQYNLWSLSAMEATRNYLEIQSNNLFDMIVDEIQNEIYLKSNSNLNEGSKDIQFYDWQVLFHSENPKLASFKALIKELKSLEQYIYNSANFDISETVDCFTEPVEHFIRDQLPGLHTHFSKNEEEVNYNVILNSTLSSSSESFHYIYMLLHTASKLNRLPQVVEILSSTDQQEMHGLIGRTTEEVKLRNINLLNKLAKIRKLDKSFSGDLINGNSFNDSSVIILQDLFGAVFIKCLAVLQKHKVVAEIVTKIKQRDAVDAKYSLEGIWDIMNNELTALMRNYIYEDSIGSGILGGGHKELIKTRTSHDNTMKNDIFKFENVDQNNTSRTTEEMKTVLQNMFPGFVLSEENQRNALSLRVGASDTQTPYIKSETSVAMVDVLVPRHIFNMRVILEFFLLFVAGSQRLFLNFKDEIKMSDVPDKQAIGFFSRYMNESFLAKVRSKLETCFNEFIRGVNDSERMISDSGDTNSGSVDFKIDVTPLDQIRNERPNVMLNTFTPNFSSAMVYQNAIDFKRLFTNACSVLNTSLTYREEYNGLCLDFLKSFGDAYVQFYNDLLTPNGELEILKDDLQENAINSNSKLLLVTWLSDPALTEMSNMILHQNLASKDLDALIYNEIKMMLRDLDSKLELFDITKDHLLDNDSLNEVCHLLVTTSWILTWLPLMKKESNFDIQNTHNISESKFTIERLRHNWSFLENGLTNQINSEIGQNVFLALNSNNINKFNKVVETFEYLRDRALVLLRYDLRLKALYYIGSSFKEGDWLPNTEPGDSDQYIGLYNKEAFYVENILSSILSPNEKDAIFYGLPIFLNKILIQGSYVVSKINGNGIKKILLNIFTLQQMLRNVMPDIQNVDFTKSSAYYELFTKPEYQLLEEISNNQYKFTNNELTNLGRLIYSEKLADGRGTSFNRSKYNELIKKINGSFI